MQYKKLYSIHVRNDIWRECDFNVNMETKHTEESLLCSKLMWMVLFFLSFMVLVNIFLICSCRWYSFSFCGGKLNFICAVHRISLITLSYLRPILPYELTLKIRSGYSTESSTSKECKKYIRDAVWALEKHGEELQLWRLS